LYNEDISFYFPGDDILRASDGKWIKRTVIKVQLTNSSDVEGKDGKYVTGVTSKANAGIESIIVYSDRGVLVAEIEVNILEGSFISGEYVQIDSAQYKLLDCYNSANITTAGSGYTIGDLLDIKDPSNNVIGVAKISHTSRGKVSAINVDEGGLGYNGNIKIVDEFKYLPINYTWNSMVLNNTPIYSSVGYNFSNKPINFAIDSVEFLGEGDLVSVKDSSNSSGSGAFGIVQTVDGGGSITSIVMLDQGDQYETPKASVISTTGSGAVLTAVGGGGGIKKIKIETFPVRKSTDTGIHIDFTSEGDGNAAAALGYGSTSEYPGYWINEDGHLSSNKKLQDNYFYQDFSYVIKVSKPITEWIGAIKNIIHPLGTKVFGEIEKISTNSIKISPSNFITDFVLGYRTGLSIGSSIDIQLSSRTSAVAEIKWSDDTLMSWGNGTGVTYTVIATATQWADETLIGWADANEMSWSAP